MNEAYLMWETYQHPKAIENPMYFWTDKVETYLSVPYGDYDRLHGNYDRLREVRDYIMKQHGLIPTVTSNF